jgi:hypothetical protein
MENPNWPELRKTLSKRKWKIVDLKMVVEVGGKCLVVLTLDGGLELSELRLPISYADRYHPKIGGYYVEGGSYCKPEE